jgi:MFS family permease
MDRGLPPDHYLHERRLGSPIGRDLHFSESDLQWVVTAYGITFGGFLLLGGRAADLLGRRRSAPAVAALRRGRPGRRVH